jgi:lysophospholipase L1-like esterase
VHHPDRRTTKKKEKPAMNSNQKNNSAYIPFIRFSRVLGIAALCVLGGSDLFAASTAKPVLEKRGTNTETEPAYNLAIDAKRKATMSPDEAAWEKVLEQNLGSFYLPGYKNEKSAGRETAWDYVKDDPNLPRVLLIGDSISRGYTLPVRHALKGKVNLHRAPANCGKVSYGIKNLDAWLGDTSNKWDVITFNFGIHDRKTSDTSYTNDLKALTLKLQATGAKLIWVNTTPVLKGAVEFVEGNSERVNKLAGDIMAELNIPVVDLYTKVKDIPSEHKINNNCHFRDGGYEILGAEVAAKIMAVLSEPPKPAGK